MEMINISILGIMWENTALGTEFGHNFCAGIGPLQLGFVLVSFVFMCATFYGFDYYMFHIHVVYRITNLGKYVKFEAL